jgi:hypothetical protein
LLLYDFEEFVTSYTCIDFLCQFSGFKPKVTSGLHNS